MLGMGLPIPLPLPAGIRNPAEAVFLVGFINNIGKRTFCDLDACRRTVVALSSHRRRTVIALSSRCRRAAVSLNMFVTKPNVVNTSYYAHVGDLRVVEDSRRTRFCKHERESQEY